VSFWTSRGLERKLETFKAYYNRACTHLSLYKDSPDERAIQPPEEGAVRELEHIGGLHHEYVQLMA